MSASIRYAPSPDVLVSHLDGEAILLHMHSKHYFRLNRVGAHIWKQLESGADGDAIVDALVATFDVSRPEAEEGLRALLQDLQQNTLVREVG